MRTALCFWLLTLLLFPLTVFSQEEPAEPKTVEAMVVDAETGIVRAVRQTLLSVSFSRKLCNSVARQYSDRYIASWSEEDFQERCRKAYREYPEPSDILRAPGCILCQASSSRSDDAEDGDD